MHEKAGWKTSLGIYEATLSRSYPVHFSIMYHSMHGQGGVGVPLILGVWQGYSSQE